MTTEEFVKKAHEIHNNIYSYKKSNYVNSNTKICIECAEHGYFWMLPHNHLKGQGCPVCSAFKCHESHKIGKDKFIEEAKKIHKNYYNYDKVVYVKSRKPVIIICPEHGEFLQCPDKHLKGCGCHYCKTGNSKIQFIQKAKKLHNNFYDYSKVNYVNSTTPVEIICPIHGSFWQQPHVHLDISRNHPKGCPECAKKSHGEKIIQDFLDKNNYVYTKQFFIQADKILKNSTKVLIDFCLKIGEQTVFIEYNGMQHYTYVPHFHRGGIIDFIKQTKRDMWLKQYCKEQNIILLTYNYLQKDKTILTKLESDLNKLM